MKHVAIIGGGASGFFTAIGVATLCPNTRVTIVEKTNKVLTKVKVSGGGRCNVTHNCHRTDDLLKNYPRGYKELQSVFRAFAVQDVIAWFNQRGVALHAEDDGRMFPVTNDAQTIVDCFEREARRYGVTVMLQQPVTRITQAEGALLLQLPSQTLLCDAAVVTTGGSQAPSAYHLATNIGHQIKTPVPSLFTFNLPQHPICGLMGVSVSGVSIRIPDTKFTATGTVLITHWGLSGPAILKLSSLAAEHLSHVGYDATFVLNWCGSETPEALRASLADFQNRHAKQKIANAPYSAMPRRLWLYLLSDALIDHDKPWGELSKKSLNKLANTLSYSEFQMKGKTTFKEEFVTCGGISLKEVNLNTMESKLIPRLYFAGEVLNVDGLTGGFNFQACWSTAFVAAKSIAQTLTDSSI